MGDDACVKKGKRILLLLALTILLSTGQSLLSGWLVREVFLRKLPENPVETAAFRQLSVGEENLRQLKEFSDQGNISMETGLAAWMTEEEFSLDGREKISREELAGKAKLLEEKRASDFSALREAYRAVFGDLEYFPVPRPSGGEDAAVFEDTFGASRTYGGQRTHEGTDLFGSKNISGYYPVVSVTDGVVEKVGWLPLGGWRIGIRSPSGGYFYYAHLDSYSRDFQEGDSVRAGELLGLMGDTGYGPEGTRGKFPVHLHFGIYIRTSNRREISVNPYAVLRYLENTAGEYTY
ncbi:MAG: M23 family metallopeptidase [Clostridiales bacterium]|nr:M23 family metallopeptidase [Clostridiales bacterium]